MELFAILFMLFLYFIPSVVASYRGHSSTAGIVILNIFLGFTFIGWVLALVWAASGKHPEKVPVKVQYNRKVWTGVQE